MTVVQLKRKKKMISKQLQDALDAIPSPDFEKLQPRVDRVFTIGREEGLGDKEIGKLVRKKMKVHYSRRTVTNVFEKYPDAKYEKRGLVRERTSLTYEEDICPKCGKPVKDPEAEVWQFNVGEFKIQAVQKAPRTYLETATEHFYAESRKWKKKFEELEAKLNKQPNKKKPRNIQKEKSDAITNALSRRLREEW